MASYSRIAYHRRIIRIALCKYIALATTSALLLVTVLGGCGGESDSKSADESAFTVQASTTMAAAKPKLTKPQFVARVNKFCRQAWNMVLDNFAQYSSWQSKKMPDRKRFSKTTRLTLMAGIDFHIFDNIRFLGSPPGQEAETERIIGPMQEAVERGQRLGPLYSVEEITELFAEYNERARRYGLRDCPVDASHIGPIEGYVYADRASSSS